MNFKKMLTVFICLILMISCMTVAASAATDSTASVTVSPSTSEVKVGDEVTFTVTLNATNIYGYECGISINGGLELVGAVSTYAPNGNFLVIPSGMTIIGGYNAEATNGEGYTGSAPIATFTCKVNGEGSVTCSVTGSKYWFNEEEDVNVKIPFAGSGDTAYVTIACEHTYEAVVTDPTCTEQGYTTYTCSKCGDSYVADYVDALGHDMKETTPAVAPTCDEDGTTAILTCSRCGYTEGGAVDPALGHKPGEVVIENATEAVCDKGGSYDKVVYCTVCKEELSRETVKVDALGHKAGEAVRENEVPATCKEAGSYEEVTYCSVCKKELSRVKKTIDKLTTHTPGKPVKENVVEATCKKAGSYEEVIYCSVCDEELSRETKTIEKLAHTPGKPVEENRVESTCTKTGSVDIVVYCSVCGEEISRDKQTIEKKPHVDNNKDDKCDICGADMNDDEPKNGDITPYFVMPVVLVSVCAAAAYVTIKRKNAR